MSHRPIFPGNRHELRQFTRCCRTAHQARKYCVAHRLGHSLAGIGQRFRDEKGVAAGDLMQKHGVSAAVLGHLFHGRHRERREPHAHDVPPREFTEREPNGVHSRQFFLTGKAHQHAPVR